MASHQIKEMMEEAYLNSYADVSYMYKYRKEQTESVYNIESGTSEGGNSDESVKVYRGISYIYIERMIHEENGQLMSDATRRGYIETGNLSEAYKLSEASHKKWIVIYGGE